MAKAFYTDPTFDPYRKTVPANKEIVRQGQREGVLGILVKGVLEVARDGYMVAEIVEPGALVGEMSIILGKPHGATVTTLTDTELIVIPRDHLSRVAARIPQFSIMIMRTLAQRLEQTNMRVAELEDSYDELYNRLESNKVAEPRSTELYASNTAVLDRPEEIEEIIDESGDEPDDGQSDAEAIDDEVLSSKDLQETHLPMPPTGTKTPLLVKEMICPAHEGGEVFPVFLLRKGAVRFGRDVYGVTEYHGAEDGYAPIDYTLQEVHVCPLCFFASNVPENFLVAEKTGSSGFYTIRRSVRDMLGFGRDVRQALVHTLPKPARLVGPERSVKEACVAFELALMVARTFFECDRSLFSSYGFRLIVYNLKLAQIQRRYRTADTEALYLGRAYDIVKENVGGFAGAQYFYTYFLAVALASRLDGEKEAEFRLEQFRKLRERASNRMDQKMSMLCGEYFLKAKDLVESGGVPISREHGRET